MFHEERHALIGSLLVVLHDDIVNMGVRLCRKQGCSSFCLEPVSFVAVVVGSEVENIYLFRMSQQEDGCE